VVVNPEHWAERAGRVLAGGVNSPARAFHAVGTPPVIAVRGEGAWLYDASGRRYLDCLLSWGALPLGHAPACVVDALREALAAGTTYGLGTEGEIELAELIGQAMPSIAKLRLVNSGTEAAMSAVRLARGFTGRNRILKFAGGYHGHADGLLVRAGSGLATCGLPGSAGVPPAFAELTLVAPYNDLVAVERLVEQYGEELAAIIVEPVLGNVGVILPEDGFLAGLRRICDRCGALLIFDEVITGFRLGWGGAQGLFGVTPDLTVLGKIIGGGLPVGAFGGRAAIMARLAPDGDVYQAGTFSGNPLTVHAGLAVLRELRRRNPYRDLERMTQQLGAGLEQAAVAAGIPLRVACAGSMFTVFFRDELPHDEPTAKQANPVRYAAFFRGMLERDILLPPSPWETAFLSTAHTPTEIATITSAAAEVLARLG